MHSQTTYFVKSKKMFNWQHGTFQINQHTDTVTSDGSTHNYLEVSATQWIKYCLCLTLNLWTLTSAAQFDCWLCLPGAWTDIQLPSGPPTVRTAIPLSIVCSVCLLRSTLRKPFMCCPQDIFAVCFTNHCILLQPNTISQSVSVLVLAVHVPGPFYHSLWRSIEEYQFGVKFLLQLQLTCLSHLKHTNILICRTGSHKHEFLEGTFHAIKDLLVHVMDFHEKNSYLKLEIIQLYSKYLLSYEWVDFRLFWVPDMFREM